ncbi:MAG: nucleotide exchange factor GrpE [Candidatus Dormibacteria bacterium]
MSNKDDNGDAPVAATEASPPGGAAPREQSGEGPRRAASGTAKRGRAPRGGAAEALEAIEQALGERNESYLRLAADFENYRRRHQQDLIDRSRYASEEAARALLPVLDNLRRALEHSPGTGDDGRLRDGLSLVVREFETALERLGVLPIEAVGTPFDPALHEAIGGDESDEVDTETVTQELQRGYRLHDRVLRPAMVRIARPAGPG